MTKYLKKLQKKTPEKPKKTIRQKKQKTEHVNPVHREAFNQLLSNAVRDVKASDKT